MSTVESPPVGAIDRSQQTGDLPSGGFAALRESATFAAWSRSVTWALICSAAALVAVVLEVLARGGDRLHLAFAQPLFAANKIAGIPHYLFAVLFLMTSRSFRAPATRTWFALLAALGVALAVVYQGLGGSVNPILHLAFALYFVVHVFRDEAVFYLAGGDPPAVDRRVQSRSIHLVGAMIVLSLVALQWPGFLFFLETRGLLPNDVLTRLLFPSSWPVVARFASYVVPVAAFNLLAARWVATRYPGGWRAFLRQERPLLAVYVGDAVLVMLLPLIGTMLLFFVLVHFVAWYRHASERLPRSFAAPRSDEPPRSATAPRSWWQSVRTTRLGFRAAYLSAAGCVFALLVLARYLWPESALLDAALSNRTFESLTILHVTLSWVPR